MNRIRQGYSRIMFVLFLFACSGAHAAPDEDAALAARQFTQPIVLHIDSDGYGQAQRLKSMNGVSDFHFGHELNPVGGRNDFRPCAESKDGRARPAVNASVSGTDSGGDVSRWLLDNRFLEWQSFRIEYPKSNGWIFWVCPLVNENARKYIPNVNLHAGFDAAIGRRILTKWTYRNRYETPMYGKGNVKAFAGTFAYRIEPTSPILSSSSEGTAMVKLLLDPDNGRWTIAEYKLQDPPVQLSAMPLEPSISAAPQATLAPQHGKGTSTRLDFIHNGITIPDPSNAGNYILASDRQWPCSPQDTPKCRIGPPGKFSISYQSSGDSFNIWIGEPLAQSRKTAQEFLMKTLGITVTEMCGLKYRVGTTVYDDYDYAGKELRFSFCPGAASLPTRPSNRKQTPRAG